MKIKPSLTLFIWAVVVVEIFGFGYYFLSGRAGAKYSKLEMCQQKCKPLIGVIEKTGNRPEGYGRPQYVNYTCVCR